MYPDLLGIFGISLFGVGFERVLWALIAAFMIWGVVSSILIIRRKRKAEGLVQLFIVGAVLFWASEKFLATFSPDYALTFSEPLVLHSYAFCILVGVGLGIWTARAMAVKRGFDPNDMSMLCLLLVVFGLIGARAAHVIVEAQVYIDSCFDPAAVGLSAPDCFRAFNFAEGGLTFYGGVLAGFLVLVWFFVRRYRRGQALSTLSVMDILAAALAIAHACGRIGCLAAGCCWGAVTSGALGIRYERGSFAYDDLIQNPLYHDAMVASGQTPLLHATQIYETTAELLLYAALWFMLRRSTKPGKMAAVWLIGYGVFRFFLEMMRDDAERGYFFESVLEPFNRFFNVAPGHATILTTSQGIALLMIVIGIGVWIVSSRQSQKTDGDEAAEESDEAESVKTKNA